MLLYLPPACTNASALAKMVAKCRFAYSFLLDMTKYPQLEVSTCLEAGKVDEEAISDASQWMFGMMHVQYL